VDPDSIPITARTSPGSKIEGTSFPGRVAVVVVGVGLVVVLSVVLLVVVVVVVLAPSAAPVQEAIRTMARATEPLVT
jgi:hypothetical protein